jgi:steroid delta-isomerase-like uncharacterized protein
MTPEQNKEIVRSYVEEFQNKGDEAVLDELVAEDYIDHDPLPGHLPGRAGMKRDVMKAAFPDSSIVVEDLLAERDIVVCRVRWSGTQAGDFLGIPNTGKHVSIGAIHVFRLEDGVIREGWGRAENINLMAQLGVMSGFGSQEASAEGGS